MRKHLLNNLSLKLISLVLAFFLWFVVVQIGDPKDERDMGNIQVKLINTELLEQENKVYEVLDGSDKVRVKVYAPKSVFTQLRNGDIMAEADISKLTDINTVPITFSASNSNIVSISGSHDVVKLAVEERASKYVNLTADTTGTVAKGYMVYSVTPDQNRIEVSGPKSIVDQVRHAGVAIDVTDATGNLTANVDIKLYDADNNIIEKSNLVKNVDYVKMFAEILAVKEIPVEAVTTGTPAQGYMATGVVECNPSTITIAGTSGNLAKIQQIKIAPEAFDITDAKETVIKQIDLKDYLPENVRLADASYNGKVLVTAYIEEIEEKTLHVPVQNLSVVNIPTGMDAQLMDSAETLYEVVVSGLRADIRPLRENTTTGIVDIDAWMSDNNMSTLKPGIYSVPVRFHLDSDITQNTALSVRIVVREKE